MRYTLSLPSTAAGFESDPIQSALFSRPGGTNRVETADSSPTLNLSSFPR